MWSIHLENLREHVFSGWFKDFAIQSIETSLFKRFCCPRRYRAPSKFFAINWWVSRLNLVFTEEELQLLAILCCLLPFPTFLWDEVVEELLLLPCKHLALAVMPGMKYDFMGDACDIWSSSSLSSTSKSKSEPAVDERDMDDDKETSHDRVPFLVLLLFLLMSGLKKEGISTIVFVSSLWLNGCER